MLSFVWLPVFSLNPSLCLCLCKCKQCVIQDWDLWRPDDAHACVFMCIRRTMYSRVLAISLLCHWKVCLWNYYYLRPIVMSWHANIEDLIVSKYRSLVIWGLWQNCFYEPICHWGSVKQRWIDPIDTIFGWLLASCRCVGWLLCSVGFMLRKARQ